MLPTFLPVHPEVPQLSSSLIVAEELEASNDGLERVTEGSQRNESEVTPCDLAGSSQTKESVGKGLTEVDHQVILGGSAALETADVVDMEREEEAVRSKVEQAEGGASLKEEKAQVESVEEVDEATEYAGLTSRDSEYATPPSPSQSTTPRILSSESTLLPPSSVVEQLEAAAEALSNRPQVDTAVTPHSNEFVSSPTHTENAAPRSPSVPSPIFSTLFQNWNSNEPQSRQSTELSRRQSADHQPPSLRMPSPLMEVKTSDGESSDGSDFGNVVGKLSHPSSGTNSRASGGPRSSQAYPEDNDERGSSGRRSTRSRSVTPTSIGSSSDSTRGSQELDKDLGSTKLTPVQLVQQLQEMLRSDPIFHYTLKGVLLDHMENKGKASKMERTERGDSEARNGNKVSAAKEKLQERLAEDLTDVQTDLEEEEEFDSTRETMKILSPTTNGTGTSREYKRTTVLRPTPSRLPRQHKYQPYPTQHPTTKGHPQILNQRPIPTQSPLDSAFIPRSESFLAREAARAAEIASRIDPQKPHRRHSLTNVPKVIVTPSLPETQPPQYTSAYPRSFKANSRVTGGHIRSDVLNGIDPKHFQKFVPKPDRSSTLPYRRGGSIIAVNGMSNIGEGKALPSLWPASGTQHFDFDDFA